MCCKCNTPSKQHSIKEKGRIGEISQFAEIHRNSVIKLGSLRSLDSFFSPFSEIVLKISISADDEITMVLLDYQITLRIVR